MASAVLAGRPSGRVQVTKLEVLPGTGRCKVPELSRISIMQHGDTKEDTVDVSISYQIGFIITQHFDSTFYRLKGGTSVTLYPFFLHSSSNFSKSFTVSKMVWKKKSRS
jgi:hypothetical protein